MSLKKNFAYSSLLTSTNYLFPLLTYPYVSRVLGVANIGICNFVDSIINYFTMFSLLGIVATGIRSVAAVKEDKERLSKVFTDLLLLNTISTAVVSVVLIACILLIPEFRQYKEMFVIGLFKVIFNYLLIDWFYKGLENFKFITNRGVIIRSLYVACVFIFVRDSGDYHIYYLLSMLAIALNAVVNVWYSRKFVSFRLRIKNISFKPYMSSFIILGIYIIITSMYTTFNIAYLGFVHGTTEVGYYTTATKLHTILLSIFTAFTGVMLPRMSSLISEGKHEQFHLMLDKSVHVLFLFSFPLIVFSTVFAPHIVLLLSGAGYENAIAPMRIIMPLIFVIGYEQIIVIQVLMPLRKDKYIFTGASAGAIVGILANILLVKSMASIGSAWVWVVSELVVMVVSQYFVHKSAGFGFPLKKLLVNILVSIPCLLVCICILEFVDNYIASLAVGALALAVYYGIVYVRICKDDMIIGLLKSLESAVCSVFRHK